MTENEDKHADSNPYSSPALVERILVAQQVDEQAGRELYELSFLDAFATAVLVGFPIVAGLFNLYFG